MKIANDLSFVLHVSSILVAAIAVLDLLALETVYSQSLAVGSTSDPPGDISEIATSAIDVTRVDAAVASGDRLTVRFYLAVAPTNLTVNRSSVDIAQMEYAWEANIDVDGDQSTGETRDFNSWIKGTEFKLSVKSFHDGSDEKVVPITNEAHFQWDVWESVGDGYYDRFGDADLITGNDLYGSYIELSGVIPGMRTTSQIRVVTMDGFENDYVVDMLARFVPPPEGNRIIGLKGSMVFGSIVVGNTSTRTLTIKNTGNSAMNITSISYPAGFSGAWSGSIPNGGSQAVEVRFAPTAGGASNGVVTVNSDKTSGINSLAISGTGITPEILVEEPLATERLSGSTIVFGQTARGFTSSPAKSYTVRNVGTSTLTISSIELTGAESAHFSVTKPRLPLVLAPRASIRIPAVFRPLSTGIKSATFVITSNDLDEGTFQLGLTGEGTQPELEFGVSATVDAILPSPITNLGIVRGITGLPRGLKYDARTGKILGRPAVSGAYAVRVTVLGADGKTTIHSMTLYVEAIPAWALGSFTSMVAAPVFADSGLTGLGGFMTLTSASAGTYSGLLRLGARSFAFKGQLDGELEATRGTEPLSSTTTIITNPKDRTQDITLNMEVRPDDHDTLPGLTGTLTFQGVNYAIQPGWQHVWNAKTKPAFGNKDRTLNVVIENNDSGAGPQGEGCARVRLTKAGVATWAATLSDGRKFTGSFTASPDGDVPFYGAITYPNGGALSAVLATEVSGDLYKVSDGPRPNGRWVKRQTSNAKVLDRVYRGGFDVSLVFSGAEYVAPARGVLLFGNPAPGKAMSFTLGGAGITSSGQLPGDDSVTLGAELRLNNVIAVPRQSGLPTTFRIAPGFSSSSGLVTGSIELSDIGSLTTKATPRTLLYQGLYIPNLASPGSSRVRGYFTLPELPDAAGETISNTPIQSGSFSVLPR